MSALRLALCLLLVTFAGSARAANPVVVIETNLGSIKIELYEQKAFGTVKNFLSYVDDKHYDGLVFHRVIEGFMIQGGGMDANGKEKKTKPPIKNEASNGLSNLRSTIAMARVGRDVGGVKAADSATSQFFINTVDNTFLDKKEDPLGIGYCVFGRVIEGMDVVDKIAKVKKKPVDDPKDRPSVPVEDVVIKSVRKVEKK
jgi:cyclophilin family peptidyl-prolyl cis-trans isomerase